MRLPIPTLSLAAALLSAAGCAPLPPPGAGGDASGATPLDARGTLRADAAWQGAVEIADDFQVPRGRTLRILAGTRVRVRPADTTKTEPEYLDNATEILVRGRLVVEGTARRPVVFEPLPDAGSPDEAGAARWGGIIFDGGEGEVRHATVAGAETGFTLLAASPLIADVAVEGARYGLAVHRGSAPHLERLRVRASETGVACWPGAAPELLGVDAEGAEHEGLLVAPDAAPRVRGGSFRGGVSAVLWGAAGGPPPDIAGSATRVVAMAGQRGTDALPPPFVPRVPPPGTPTRAYRGESFIGEDTAWEGEVLVDGTVMVSPLARLAIAPGTVVRFTFRDSDGDGVGESEIFVQGVLAAEGTPERPIVFTALDGEGPGRWGAINIMGSDERESSLAYCLVEKSFRGLHSHFSRFRVARSVFRGNHRSLQFQESKAAVSDCEVTGSASGLRFRDSTVALDGLVVRGNTLGVQTLRSTFSLTRSVVAGNALAGVHVRESEGEISGCVIAENSPGLRVSESHVKIEGNLLRGNSVGGLLLRRTEARVEANRILDSVGNSVSTDSRQAVLRRNAIAGELRFAVENNAAEPVDAAGNWWGSRSPTADRFWDREDDPRLGPILLAPALAAPPPAR